MTYKIDVYAGPDKFSKGTDFRPEIYEYFVRRKDAFINTLGKGQAKYYGTFPTEHDRRSDTVFLVFSTTDKKVVFGGRRLVFPHRNEPLPFEGKHNIRPGDTEEEHNSIKKAISRFPRLQGKVDKLAAANPQLSEAELRGQTSLDIKDVVPGIAVERGLKYAEMGGFAIDRNITMPLFSKDEYVAMREDIYRKSLEAAKEQGVDILVIEPGANNLKNQGEWFKEKSGYEFMLLGRNTGHLVTNPFPEGKESLMLVVNLSPEKYKLTGPEGVLRFKQGEAHKMRLAAERAKKALSEHEGSETPVLATR